LLDVVKGHLQGQPTVLHLFGPIHVVGDIHGNLQDLLRILRTYGLGSKYLFLGDYVDRGEYSLECILLLFVLACKFPGQFYLLRGNHECRPAATVYGFKDDLVSTHSEELFEKFIDVFAWLPLAAVVNQAIFCVHGGIIPGLRSIGQIEELRRPLPADHPMVTGLLWADPTAGCAFFRESARGESYEFGPRALADFLGANNLRSVLRAHQCVNGVQNFPGMPLATVFSSSGYSQDKGNKAGVVFSDKAGDTVPHIFDSIVSVVARTDAAFYRATRQAMPKPKVRQILARPRKMVPGLLPLSRSVIARTTFPLVTPGTQLRGFRSYHSDEGADPQFVGYSGKDTYVYAAFFE
jgi:diadenosine tetraphosphatase ApaH/serine/threonine PP2A family protein phosphatase